MIGNILSPRFYCPHRRPGQLLHVICHLRVWDEIWVRVRGNIHCVASDQSRCSVMIHWLMGWYTSYCAPPLVERTSEKRQNIAIDGMPHSVKNFYSPILNNLMLLQVYLPREPFHTTHECDMVAWRVWLHSGAWHRLRRGRAHEKRHPRGEHHSRALCGFVQVKLTKWHHETSWLQGLLDSVTTKRHWPYSHEMQ